MGERVRRVLWVTPIRPTVSVGGGGLRQVPLLREVASRTETVLVTVPGPIDPVVAAALAGRIDVDDRDDLVAATASPWRRRLSDLWWLARPGAPHRDVHRRRRTLDRWRWVVRRVATEFDLVVVEYHRLASVRPAGSHRASWILTFHNVESAMIDQAMPSDASSRLRFLNAVDGRRARRFERREAARYDRVVVVSNEDRRLLGLDAAVVENAVDCASFAPSPLPTSPRLVFTGALHTAPNEDGIVWFVREVFPRLRTRIPTATLEVVGAAPTPAVRRVADVEGVSVVADVADTRPHLESARVAVVPLRIGTGTRLKALEAMAAGRPVVGTTVGLGGLSLRPGTEALFADDADAFATQVLRLLEDDAMAVELAAAGRAVVERRHDVDVVVPRFLQVVGLDHVPARTDQASSSAR